MHARQIAERHQLPIKIVDAEPILGGERLTISAPLTNSMRKGDMATTVQPSGSTRRSLSVHRPGVKVMVRAASSRTRKGKRSTFGAANAARSRSRTSFSLKGDTGAALRRAAPRKPAMACASVRALSLNGPVMKRST